MPVSIEVNNESGAAVDEAGLVRLSRFVLDALGVHRLAELSLVLVDVEAMSALHQQWMDLPGPTDVMAFPMDAEDGLAQRLDPSDPRPPDDSLADAMLGDVVLCPAVAAEQAAAAGHSVEAELHLLCTHGILHLLGYDHGDEQTEREMFEVQSRLLHDWSAHAGVGPIRVPVSGGAGEVRATAADHRHG